MSETELDEVETLADLADLAREAAQDDDSVLVFIEQEDAWFAVIRVDGEDDPRIFVSDGAAAARSSYGAVLTDELVDRVGDSDFDDDFDTLVAELDDEDAGAEADSEVEDEEEDERDAGSGAVPVGPLGDFELLADLGITAGELVELSGEGAAPGDALSEIAEALGCGEVLEAVR